ncbi:hypothetical protein BHE74_00013581 [Ensete ventricosum]|nr:hypothetical protein BHE74_00013581 [Ensete ventricosum]
MAQRRRQHKSFDKVKTMEKGGGLNYVGQLLEVTGGYKRRSSSSIIDLVAHIDGLGVAEEEDDEASRGKKRGGGGARRCSHGEHGFVYDYRCLTRHHSLVSVYIL